MVKQIPIALISAASAAGGVAHAVEQRHAMRGAQALEQHMATLRRAENERDNQEELAKTLAKQNVRYAASGVDTGSGSAQSLLHMLRSQADHRSADLSSKYDMDQQNRLYLNRSDNRKSKKNVADSLLDFGQSVHGQVRSLWK